MKLYRFNSDLSNFYNEDGKSLNRTKLYVEYKDWMEDFDCDDDSANAIFYAAFFTFFLGLLVGFFIKDLLF